MGEPLVFGLIPGLPAYGFDIVELPDGSRLRIRPIWLTDVAALRRMHGRLSQEALYYRFMTACPRASSATLRYLAGVDHVARDALVALDRDEIVAVARYHTVADGEAEVAIIVEDAWQRRGLGREMMQHLAAIARVRGLRSFTGSMLADNKPATALLLSQFPDAIHKIEDGELIFRIPLQQVRTTV